ncbi:unnamed protein product [Paramecium octaurelia]|uniref:Uncharacterized protein n=1 Tax=Paramecium octaurelia TaxID=43137 RepID=A0A8S1YPU9_PAROT|nr:unnamed protein product [Paramecium octaurelia]
MIVIQLIHLSLIKSNTQIKEIINQMSICFEWIQKQIDLKMNALENLNIKLLNQQYLTFKSQIKVIKHFTQGKKKVRYVFVLIIEITTKLFVYLETI